MIQVTGFGDNLHLQLYRNVLKNRIKDYIRFGEYKCEVIGAGSVVTKNIPDNCVAVVAPCQIILKINLTEAIVFSEEAKYIIEYNNRTSTKIAMKAAVIY